MTTTYTQLQLHLSRHEYKRGQYTGDAPADSSRRSKTDFRVRKYGDTYTVRFHNADLITAHPNGDIVLNCNGWGNSVTTGQAMHYSLRFCDSYIGFGSTRLMGLSQLYLLLGANPPTKVKYYDGIRLNGDGAVISELKPFLRKQIDKAQVKALNEGMAESGFKDVFRLLHGTVTREDARCTNRPPPIVEMLTSKEHAEHWPTVIAQAAFFNVEGTGAETWARVMNAAKSNMYEVVETDITKIGETT